MVTRELSGFELPLKPLLREYLEALAASVSIFFFGDIGDNRKIETNCLI
jgi:hypothetical protein